MLENMFITGCAFFVKLAMAFVQTDIYLVLNNCPYANIEILEALIIFLIESTK